MHHLENSEFAERIAFEKAEVAGNIKCCKCNVNAVITFPHFSTVSTFPTGGVIVRVGFNHDIDAKSRGCSGGDPGPKILKSCLKDRYQLQLNHPSTKNL